MNISVNGLGIVSKAGNTEDVIRLFAGNGRIDPWFLHSSRSLPIDFPDDMNISQQLIRRMSHFAKLSLLSACDAVKDSGLDLSGKSIGIIQGSVYGPIISGIQAFDDLIDFGDNQLSPTNFSGSVFNTSATYLSLAFGIQGSTLTHTSGLDTLYNSFLTASLWLETHIADYVIVGIGDEYSSFFDVHALPKIPQTNLLPTAEGWTTFILSTDPTPKYGKIRWEHLQSLPETKNSPVIYSIWHESTEIPEFQEHSRDNQACFPVHVRGSYPSASAFDLGLALVCAKQERFPVNDGPVGNYQIQTIHPNPKIRCLCATEGKGVYSFEVGYVK
jgi:hypothetical protein